MKRSALAGSVAASFYLGLVAPLLAAEPNATGTVNQPSPSEKNVSAAKPAEKWDQWELEIGYANSHVLYFDDEVALADKAFKRWESRNPWPDEPDYSSHNERIADFSRLKSAQSAHCERYQNALRQ